MRKSLIIIAGCFLGTVSLVQAESTTAAVQQKLKDQGFYYGEITGTNDADTTAAIRRYQIRNGLKITGQLDTETQKSLGVRGSVPDKSATPPPPRGQTGAPPPKTSPTPDVSDLRDTEPVTPKRPGATQQQPPEFQPGNPQPSYPPGPRGLYPATSGVFDGTPFDVAPADVQRRVVLSAQTLLARQGYYRDVVDGDFGPGTAAAVRAYQSRFRIAPSGRLDRQTLGALGLLPGQRAPGIDVPRRRIYQPPAAPGPGERIYIPR